VFPGVSLILRIAAAILAAAVFDSSAGAEPFIDFYLGPGRMPDTTVTAEHQGFDLGFFVPEPTTQTATREVSFDSSISYGLRFGWWFRRNPRLGFAGDFAHWDADAANLEVGINTLAASLLYRWRGNEDSEQRFVPYIGFGLAVFDADISADFRPAIAQRISVSSQDLGYSAQVGISWRLQRAISLLLEYRLTRASGAVEARSQSESIRLYAPTDKLQATIAARQLLAGISFRFQR